MRDGDSLIDPQSLAGTYDGGSYTDAWSVVEQYREATAYAQHNNAGSSATASALELPRGRLRTWIDSGGKPDVVRGLETAREHGWLECGVDDPAFTALNALVANVFSGGSIADQHYQPSFALNHHGADASVIDALELAGVEYDIVADREGRGDEARPTDDGTVLGRVLAALGAPVGSKADQHLELPAYLEDAPAEVRETFVYAYLENRAQTYAAKATVTFREERNGEYLGELAGLIESVAGQPVRVSEHNVVISADAARNLGTVR